VEVAKRIVTLPCKHEKGLLDTFVNFRRGFHELDAELVSEGFALLLRYSAFICPVAFVADEDLVHAFRGMLFDVGVPRPNV
jgi:hypothetical protein